MVLAELHGLATDRITGRIVPIGTTHIHSLRGYIFPHDAKYAASVGSPVRITRMFAMSSAQPVYSESDAFERWATAVAALPHLNELDIDYPPYGTTLLSSSINSNSVYRTFADVMGVAPYRFPGVLQPGIDNSIVGVTQLNPCRFAPRGSS